MSTNETNAMLNHKYQMKLGDIKSTIKEFESFVRTMERTARKEAPGDVYKGIKATTKKLLKDTTKVKQDIFKIRFRQATHKSIQDLENIHQEVIETFESFKESLHVI